MKRKNLFSLLVAGSGGVRTGSVRYSCIRSLYSGVLLNYSDIISNSGEVLLFDTFFSGWYSGLLIPATNQEGVDVKC